jgi:SRSO17 transposase
MSIQDIAKLGRMLGQFLRNFSDCFSSAPGRALLAVYVRGLLSGVGRKNAEAIALDQDVAPRTLQRFLGSIVWDDEKLRDRCQQIVANDHADPHAIGCVDETGTTKSGDQTAGVKRQYNGNRGKIENCVNSVALAYSAPGFDCLLDARLYLPQEWADDPVRRKKTTFPTPCSSRRNRKLRWNRLAARWATGFESWRGRRMNFTVATAPFWMGWMGLVKRLWWRFQPTRGFGWRSRGY